MTCFRAGSKKDACRRQWTSFRSSSLEVAGTFVQVNKQKHDDLVDKYE